MPDTDAGSGHDDRDAGWFRGLRPEAADADAARERIAAGEAAAPRDWPRLAVDSGFAESESAYYDRLHEATMGATREAVRERERADDQQLIHAVRAMTTSGRSMGRNHWSSSLRSWSNNGDKRDPGNRP